VVVLADAAGPSPFLDELTGVAREAAQAPERPSTSASGTGRAGRPAGPVAELTPAAEKAFAALREWRTEQARREKMPPYVVMSDAHLRGIAAQSPASPTELSRCPGIGPVKLERYGDDILRVLEGAAAG
jgi:ATP-dependent DNA helicase RecQ